MKTNCKTQLIDLSKSKKLNYKKIIPKYKFNTFKYLRILFICLVMWVSLSTVMQAFICPSMTQTELFLNIPKSFILEFKLIK